MAALELSFFGAFLRHGAQIEAPPKRIRIRSRALGGGGLFPPGKPAAQRSAVHVAWLRMRAQGRPAPRPGHGKRRNVPDGRGVRGSLPMHISRSRSSRSPRLMAAACWLLASRVAFTGDPTSFNSFCQKETKFTLRLDDDDPMSGSAGCCHDDKPCVHSIFRRRSKP